MWYTSRASPWAVLFSQHEVPAEMRFARMVRMNLIHFGCIDSVIDSALTSVCSSSLSPIPAFEFLLFYDYLRIIDFQNAFQITAPGPIMLVYTLRRRHKPQRK